MVDVTSHNFNLYLDEISLKLEEACFTCLDFEFSGLHTKRCPDISLFDTTQERYHILKESCVDFSLLQCGLSIFKYDKGLRVYTCSTYNFFLFPCEADNSNHQVVFDTGACEFLMQYDFDFNKCFYGGIPHLNEEEIERISREAGSMMCTEDIVLNNTKLAFKNRKMQFIEKWVNECSYGVIDFVDCFSKGMSKVLAKEIENTFDDVVVNFIPKESSIIEIKKVSKEEKNNILKNRDQYPSNKLNDMIGFTHIFRLLCKYKIPLVGHNLLMDVMFAYQKFYNPLPDSYLEFKFTLLNHFPPIYDTRHIISNIKVDLRKDNLYKDLFKGTSLLSLFEECERVAVKGMLYMPVIKNNLIETSGMKEHDAGYDSYLVGSVFLRLAHFYTSWKFTSPALKAFHFQDYIREFSNFKNCLNLIRCAVTHIDLGKDDPISIRPQWLFVKTIDKSSIDLVHVSLVFSAFGDVDVRKVSDTSCLVAMPSIGMAAGLLVVFKDHHKYKVSRYDSKIGTISYGTLTSLTILPLILFSSYFAVTKVLNR